jgi:ABC-type transporter Mla MlaB component
MRNKSEEQTMSIFGKIMSSIFGKASASGATPTATGAKPSSTAAATAPTGQAGEVDVAGILTKLASEKKEKLDWRTSIVDLMKLLDLDSSLLARKELAQELHYSGDMNDSASMNVWLHRQVMQKLAENGGKVPDELKT